MRFVTPEKEVSTEHPILGDLSVAVEVPQPENWDEAHNFHGGQENSLAFLSEAIATSAKNRARAYLRTFKVPEGYTDADKARVSEEVKTKAQELARTYTPESAATREPSAKKKAEKLDTLRDRMLAGEELSREEILS